MNNGLQPSWLKCEYEIEPIGLDVRHPRFSWIVEKKGIFSKKHTRYLFQMIWKCLMMIEQITGIVGK